MSLKDSLSFNSRAGELIVTPCSEPSNEGNTQASSSLCICEMSKSIDLTCATPCMPSHYPMHRDVHVAMTNDSASEQLVSNVPQHCSPSGVSQKLILCKNHSADSILSDAHNTLGNDLTHCGSDSELPSLRRLTSEAPPQQSNLAPLVSTHVSTFKLENSELENQTKKLRGVLAKVSKDNFAKLGESLVSDFPYDEALLSRLVSAIFDKATASQNFAQLYSELCFYLIESFARQELKRSEEFSKQILLRAQECFEINEAGNCERKEPEGKRRRKLVGNARFIAALFKLRLVKSFVMCMCFDELFKDLNFEESVVEATCLIYQQVAPLLAASDINKLSEYFSQIEAWKSDSRLSRRVQFKVQDVIDAKEKLMTPCNLNTHSDNTSITAYTISCKLAESRSPTKRLTRVRFLDSSDSDEEKKDRKLKRWGSSSKVCSILKKEIHTQNKAKIHSVVRSVIQGRNMASGLDALQHLITEDLIPPKQIFNHMFKYALYELKETADFDTLCELVGQALEHPELYLRQEAIRIGLAYTIESLDQIKLDSPMAPKHLQHIISKLHHGGVVTEYQDLLDCLN